jgi:hypothetical protein
MVLMNYALPRDRGAFLVAFPAQERHFERRYGGEGIPGRHNIVRTMTITASGSQSVTSRYRFPMERFRVQFLFSRVTRSAIHACEILVVRKVPPFEVDMT